jgi:outer membrane lipoprotein carrier protein
MPFILLAAALALGAPSHGAAGQSADPYAVLEEAGRVHRAAVAVCADFRQTLTVPLLGEDRTGRGRLCSRQPDRFAMRFTEPAGDLLVADGTWLWLYQPSADAKQVLRSALAGGTRGIDFYAEFLAEPRVKYTVEDLGREQLEGRTVHHLRLVPKAAAPYRNAELWIDVESAHVRRVTIREENGSVRVISLGPSEVGAPPADFFRFVPPPGSQVISR